LQDRAFSIVVFSYLLKNWSDLHENFITCVFGQGSHLGSHPIRTSDQDRIHFGVGLRSASALVLSRGDYFSPKTCTYDHACRPLSPKSVERVFHRSHGRLDDWLGFAHSCGLHDVFSPFRRLAPACLIRSSRPARLLAVSRVARSRKAVATASFINRALAAARTRDTFSTRSSIAHWSS